MVDGEITVDRVEEDAIFGLDVDLQNMLDADGYRYAVSGELDHPEDGLLHFITRVVRAPLEVPEPQDAAEDQLSPRTPQQEVRLRDGLDEWLATAPSDAQADVIVRGNVDPQIGNPPSVFALYPHDPAFAVAHELMRLEAMERARTAAADLRAPVIAAMEAAGGELVSELQAVNAFRARVTPAALTVLLNQSAVRFVEPAHQGQLDNGGREIRWAVQGHAYHEGGYVGSAPTGHARDHNEDVIDRVVIGVIDNQLDADHPVFQDDGSGTDRLVDYWYWDPLAIPPQWVRSGEAVAIARFDASKNNANHGTRVSHQALGDLLDGQDPLFSTWEDRATRTGMAPEAKLVFVERHSQRSFAEELDQMYTVFPDVVNNSGSVGKETPARYRDTDYTSTAVSVVNVAAAEGILWVQTPGNEGHPPGSGAYPCTASIPAHAAGAFVVNPARVDDSPLIDEPLTNNASRGANHPAADGDAASSLITVVAPGGRKQSSSASYNDDYTSTGASSSLAAPVVAGGAALLEDFLVDEFPSMTGDAGFAYAILLLMADGRMESGSVAEADPFDSVWGGGYFRMRLFNATGMDAPAKMHFGSTVVANSEVHWIPMNGVQPLPSAVDHMRASAWWMEPDLTPNNPKSANIEFSICNTTTCKTVPQNLDNKKRIRHDFLSSPSKPFAVKLEGVNVPGNDWSGWCDNGSTYPHEWCNRRVYWAYFAEDQARDDLDGPCAADGIGDTGVPGCP